MTPDRLITVKARTTEAGCNILALADGSDADRLKCPVLKFLTELKRAKPDLFKKLEKELKLAAEQGPSDNKEKFRHLKGGDYEGLCEFKAKIAKVGAVRLFCFFDGDRVILCTHAADKANEREMEQEYDKAAALRQEYRRVKTANGPLPLFP